MKAGLPQINYHHLRQSSIALQWALSGHALQMIQDRLELSSLKLPIKRLHANMPDFQQGLVMQLEQLFPSESERGSDI